LVARLSSKKIVDTLLIFQSVLQKEKNVIMREPHAEQNSIGTQPNPVFNNSIPLRQ
jgi:hypothetical protein